MKKLIPAIALLIAPSLAFSQARLVINGTSNVTIVESGGTSAKPVYLEIANPNANAITVTGTNGWIISEAEFNMVKWDIGTTTGTYTVPFGYGTSYYIPLVAKFTAGALGTGSILFSTYHTIADQKTGVTSLTGDPSDVTNMFPMNLPGSPSNTDNSYNAVDRFWIIDAAKFPYILKPVLNTVTFNYIHSGLPEFSAPNNAADENDLIAQRYNSVLNTWGDWLGSGSWSTSGNNGTVVNTNSVSALNFYRSWTLTNSINPLPIELSSFTAQCDNGPALIQWTSQSELNNDYYTVEKTSDNVHFETVGIVQGAGTTSLPSNYSLKDASPFDGQSYYLLFQTDFDGNRTQVGDPVIFTGCGGEVAPVTTVNAYNSSSNIILNINAVGADNVTISLVNMLGQEIFSQMHSVNLGNNEIYLPNDVPAGVYVLVVKNDKINYSQKMILGKNLR